MKKLTTLLLILFSAFTLIQFSSNSSKNKTQIKVAKTNPVIKKVEKANPVIKNDGLFNVNGRLSVENGSADSSVIMVYQLPSDSIIKNLSGITKFGLQFDYNQQYRIDFSKENYQTKRILVNTNIPDSLGIDFPPFQIQVSLMKARTDLEKSTIDIAGKIFYNPEINNFDSEAFF